MTHAIDDAILRLKAEIIAQDWRLSPKRAEQLETAFASLRMHFANRKPLHAMLVMATNVLAYIKTRGNSPPETIDFLKEAMAHIVNLHEDLADDPTHEEKLFRGLFTRFTSLKTKIQSKGGSTSQPTIQPAPPEPSSQPQPQSSSSNLSAKGEQEIISVLCAEFNKSLARTGSLGSQIATLFATWLDSPVVYSLLHDLPLPSVSLLDDTTPNRQPVEVITSCPPTPVKVFTIGDTFIVLQSSAIAMLRTLSPSIATLYLRNATVPLKDYSRFLQKLAHQFTGSLARVDERTLQTLSLPIMIPQGHNLPEAPAPLSSTLVILSSGNRHGAILCESVQEHEQTMIKFAKQQNGDIAGTAYMEDGGTFPLLDPFTMLNREGILLILEH
ncbi:MAG: hypothetical protein KKD63_02325 [Proteobacteria bacterium]|nr:hypothetical protein [Desulfobulbaceae bacterium]MBU4151698.1 hypothetical protein [Pseudomonadota bacterium]